MANIVFRIISNTVAIWVCARLIPGFTLSVSGNTNDVGYWITLLFIGLILFIINAAIKPILQVILFPAIILSLGLISVVINLGLLKVFDLLVPEIAITGLLPLILASFIISIVNTLFGMFTD